MHVEDLIEVERRLGYRYQMETSEAEHYQWICPPCRRALFGIAQGHLWQPMETGWARSTERPSTPSYVNPAEREGPLGEEDAANFHP
jgi:hypothetical protein